MIAEVERSAPPGMGPEAVRALEAATAAYEDGRLQDGNRYAIRAAQLAPRSPAARELHGLFLYDLGRYREALAELRAFRRLAGEDTHLPEEIDCLRALGREADAEATWAGLQNRRDVDLDIVREARIVVAAMRRDAGRLDEAWTAVGGDRLTVKGDPSDGEFRLWFVAADIARLRGDRQNARRLVDQLLTFDVDLAGMDALVAGVALLGEGQPRRRPRPPR